MNEIQNNNFEYLKNMTQRTITATLSLIYYSRTK